MKKLSVTEWVAVVLALAGAVIILAVGGATRDFDDLDLPSEVAEVEEAEGVSGSEEGDPGVLGEPAEGESEDGDEETGGLGDSVETEEEVAGEETEIETE